MKRNNKILISLVINILVFLFVIIGTILVYTIKDSALVAKGFAILKYFTFQSNVFMGVVSLIIAIYQILILKGKKDKIPHILTIFNFVGVVAVSVTFLVVVTLLGPLYGYGLMYGGANLFYHALLPLFAIGNYLFLEDNDFNFKWTFLGPVSVFLYGIVYLSNVAALNAYGDLKVDFYGFGQQGLGFGILYFIILLLLTYGFGVLIYYINRLVFKKRR